jgi:hypothetical protein
MGSIRSAVSPAGTDVSVMALRLYVGRGVVYWTFTELTPRHLSPHKLRRSKPQSMSSLQSWNLQFIAGLGYTAL